MQRSHPPAFKGQAGHRLDYTCTYRLNPSRYLIHMVDAHPKHLLSVVDLTEMSLAAWLRGRRPA